MARKRRGSSGGGKGSAGGKPRQLNGRPVTQDDISDDEIDTFHDQRDKILLDVEKERQDADVDHFDALGGEHGVLAVDEADSDDEGDDDEEESDGEEEEEEEDEVSLLPSRSASSKKTPALTKVSDDDDEEDVSQVEEEETDMIGGWGANKRAYYNTNDLDDIESDSEMDEEEKRAMELAEVKRMQRRARQAMIDEDFGLGGEEADAETGAAAREQRKRELDPAAGKQANSTITVAPASTSSHDPAVLMAKIQHETPETMALIGEYADVLQELNKVTLRMDQLQAEKAGHATMGLLHLHHQTLLTYVTALTFYFYLRALPSFASGTSRVKQDSVVQRLAKLKEGLSSLENFGVGVDEDEEEGGIVDLSGEEGESDEVDEDDLVSFLYRPDFPMGDDAEDGEESLGSLEEDELMQLDAEEEENEKENVDRHEAEKASRKSAKAAKKEKKKEQKEAAKASSSSKKGKQPVIPLAALSDMLGIDDDEDEEQKGLVPRAKRRKQSVRESDAAYDAYGEATALSTADQADKEATRRSLKFYTGQIDARDGQKGAGSRQLSGDQDIPYRDKERSRIAVAAANQSKALRANGAAAGRQQLDGEAFGEADARDWRDVMNVEADLGEAAGGGGDDDDGYYDLVTSARRASKQQRKEQHDEERMAQRVAPEDALGDGEQRGINREMEKNRGLTPHRPKSVRNPRVKKRMRYEAAQKKLSSRGPVYKGGQGALQGGYGGETSGISSHVVKSRQFAS